MPFYKFRPIKRTQPPIKNKPTAQSTAGGGMAEKPAVKGPAQNRATH